MLSVVRALARNFPSFDLFLTNDVDLLIVASNRARLAPPDWSVIEFPAIAADLERFQRLTPAALEATRLITRAELEPLLTGDDGINSDFYPTLDLGAERARFLRREAHGFAVLPHERLDLAAALGGRRIGWTSGERPSLSHHRTRSQAFSALLRTGGTATGTDSADVQRRLQGARLRDQRLRLELASDRAPVDWPIWFSEVLQVERDRHQGTMGVVDSAWYRDIERFMVARAAPPDAIAALRFLRAAATYDWRGAARQTDELVAARDARKPWLPLGLFFDAAVIARLRSGDVHGARVLFTRLATASGRTPDDLRTQLLDAHVKAAELALQANPAADTTTPRP